MAPVHPAGGAKLISLEKPVHGYLWHVYAVRAVAVWAGALPLESDLTHLQLGVTGLSAFSRLVLRGLGLVCF